QAVDRDKSSATLKRDKATIGLAVNGADPEQASCYFEVENLEQLREDLIMKGSSPSEMRMDQYGGNKYRVFFDKEPYGVCFCFGTKLP
ncbi:MAG: glyoxalase/bleomycin resistance/extradiol dioxygenase family protein, partial [Chlorobia bacterium]|nr:glyoxalase/bleomycin resistance/extradiol dioxygenase family protein [Fimbriimonadaceae bacterium]